MGKYEYSFFEGIKGWCSNQKHNDLFHYIEKMKCKNGLEIGVFGGSSLIREGLAIKENGGQLIGIDPYTVEDSNKYDEEGTENFEWWGKVDYDFIKNDCLDKIEKYDLQDNVKLIITNSNNYKDKVKNNSLDFLHIDGNHTEKQSLEDCQNYLPKLKQGGLLVMDDIDYKTVKKARDFLEKNCKMLKDGGTYGIYQKK